MTIDKQTIKDAVLELNKEQHEQREKVAEMRTDAFILGMHAFLKDAGITDPEAHEEFMSLAAAFAEKQARK